MKYIITFLSALFLACGVFAGSTPTASYAVQCRTPRTDWIDHDLERARRILKKYREQGYSGCAIIRRTDGKIIEI
jgi:hypothetical protein